jgi:hypothetical protein
MPFFSYYYYNDAEIQRYFFYFFFLDCPLTTIVICIFITASGTQGIYMLGWDELDSCRIKE